MPAKKTGFTLKQHDQLGLELQTIYDRMQIIVSEISENYPVSGPEGKAYRLAKQIVSNVFDLRAEMSRHAGNENTHLSHEDIQRLYEKKFCDIHISNPRPIRPFPQE